MIKISLSNTKLGTIPSVNLPPIKTCRPNCPCASKCYARKGHFVFQNVKNTLENNLSLYQSDSETYFREIFNFIDAGALVYRYFRWHASGDIIDDDYFAGMVDIAKRSPLTSFLAFTKKYEIVNSWVDQHGAIPPNLHIVFSAWGKALSPINPHQFPVAYVALRNPEERGVIPKDAIPCSGHCDGCFQCWNLQNGQSVYFNQH